MKKPKNFLFWLGCFASILFLMIPLVLHFFPAFESCISLLLSPLKSVDYKTTYIETIGAILGTYMAITGAIWTQRKIDEVAEKKEITKAATIVYYDFDFAFKDFEKILGLYSSRIKCQSNVLSSDEQVEAFSKIINRYRVYIDDKWITNVANLAVVVSSEELKRIYGLYGDISTIKSVLSSVNPDVDDIKLSYSLIYKYFSFIFTFTDPVRIEIDIKDEWKELFSLIKEVAEID